MKLYELQNRTPLLDALVSVWEDSVRATHHFLSDEEILKIKTYVPQAAAHHINAYFLRGLFVPNKQYRLAAERLRCNGKFWVLHCRDLGHRSGRFKGLLQFAVGLRHDLLEIEQPCRLF